MTAYELAKKFINAKTLDEATITKRVNTFYLFGQVAQGEYEQLMQLIEVNYSAAV